jgi:hypothetical protein
MTMTRTFPASSGGTYTARRYADGSESCDCPAWKFVKKGHPRDCKHLRAWATEAGAPAAPVRPAAPVAPASLPTPAPMLASAMTERVTGDAFDRTYAGWLLEQKLDGHRCTARVSADGAVAAWSRPRAGSNGPNPRTLPAAVIAQLQTLGPGLYDGELVAPSGKSWDVTRVGAALVFVIFDVLALDGTDYTKQPYTARRSSLLTRLAKLPADQTAISTVESLPASWRAVEAIWARGGEGAILKRPTAPYQIGQRSQDWIKVKTLHAATLTIIGFDAGKNGPYSAFVLRDGAMVRTTVKIPGNALLAQVAAAPPAFLGRKVVISYQEKTPSGTYRHGMFDHFAGPGECPPDPPVHPSAPEDPMKKPTKPAQPARKVAPAVKAQKIAQAKALKAAAAKPAVAPKPAPKAAKPATGRAAVDWVAAGRKAYETKMRNRAEAEKAAQAGGVQ